MIIIIDNYDSFTYNLVQYIGVYTDKMKVFKNDQITVSELTWESIDRILISPGPKSPVEAGISKEVIDFFKGKVPIFGVCLGHQAIGEVFDGQVVHAPSVMHGKTSIAIHDGRGIFKNVRNEVQVGRYHSLVIDPQSFPHCKLKITAKTLDGVILGVRHLSYLIEGVQFHPESVLTDDGLVMVENFLNM